MSGNVRASRHEKWAEEHRNKLLLFASWQWRTVLFLRVEFSRITNLLPFRTMKPTQTLCIGVTTQRPLICSRRITSGLFPWSFSKLRHVWANKRYRLSRWMHWFSTISLAAGFCACLYMYWVSSSASTESLPINNTLSICIRHLYVVSELLCMAETWMPRESLRGWQLVIVHCPHAVQSWHHVSFSRFGINQTNKTQHNIFISEL